MDDTIVVGNDLLAITNLKAFLNQQFKLEDIAHLNILLGLEIDIVLKVLLFVKRKYTLEDTGLLHFPYF